MADDLATLSLRLSNEQAIADAKEAGAAFEDMGNKGEQARDKLGRFTGASNPVADSLKRQAGAAAGLSGAFQPLGAQITDSTRRMTLLQLEAIKMNAALDEGAKHVGFWGSLQQQAAGHTGEHSIAVGRLERALAGIVGHFIGANQAAELLGSGLLKFAAGTLETAGILGGLALLVGLYEKLTEGARKAKEEADKLTASLVDQARAAYQATQAGATAVAWAAEQNQANVQKESGFGVGSFLTSLLTGRPTLSEGDAEKQSTRLGDAAQAVAQAWANVGKIVEEAMKKADEAAKKAANTAEELARKAQEAFLRYQALVRSTSFSPDSLGGESLSGIVKGTTATSIIRHTMTDAELAAITDPMAKEIQDAIKTNAAAAVSIAVGAYKQGTGQVLADAARDIAERNKKMLNEMQRDLANFFTDIFTKGIKSFSDLFTSIKDMFLRLLAEMAAANIMKRLAGMFTAFGSGGEGFLGSNRWSVGGKLLGAAGLGLGAGVAAGDLTGSAGGGAFLGAAGGAAAGFAVAGPIGAFVGGIAGLTSGLLSGASAAREAAAAMRQLQKDYTAAVMTFKHDDLGTALAQNAAQAEALRAQAEKLFGTFDAIWQDIVNHLTPGSKLTAANADIAAQEAKNAATIQRQAQYAQEDLVVRNLRATGQGSAADLQAFKNQQAREMQAALDANRDATYINTLRMVQQNELLAYLNNTLSTALNVVSGYRLQATIFGATNPRTPGGAFLPPINPLGPNTGSGLTPPGGRGDLTVPLIVDGKVLAQVVLKNFRGTAQRQFGDTTKWSEIQ